MYSVFNDFFRGICFVGIIPMWWQESALIIFHHLMPHQCQYNIDSDHCICNMFLISQVANFSARNYCEDFLSCELSRLEVNLRFVSSDSFTNTTYRLLVYIPYTTMYIFACMNHSIFAYALRE